VTNHVRGDESFSRRELLTRLVKLFCAFAQIRGDELMPGFTLQPHRPLFADHVVDTAQLQLLLDTFVVDSFDADKMYCIFHSRDRVFAFFNPHPSVVEEVQHMTAFERLHRFADAGAIVGAYAGTGDKSSRTVLVGLHDCTNRFVWHPLGMEDPPSLTFQLLYVPNLNSYCTAPCSTPPCEVGELEPQSNEGESLSA
jgi:hypothetical protein